MVLSSSDIGGEPAHPDAAHPEAAHPEAVHPEAARLDELRRRLYRPEASEDDRREYAALRAEQRRRDAAAADPGRAEAPDRLEEEHPGTGPGERPPARRRRTRLLLGALTVTLVVAAAVGLAVVDRAPRPVGDPTRSAVAATAAQQGVGSGPFSEPISTVAPTPVALSVEGLATVGQQASGSGSAVVPLDGTFAPGGGGRLAVALSSSDPAPVGWRAERPANRADHTGYLQIVAGSAPALRDGAARPEASTYDGSAPTRIVVEAPTGTGWRLVVAIVPPADPQR